MKEPKLPKLDLGEEAVGKPPINISGEGLETQGEEDETSEGEKPTEKEDGSGTITFNLRIHPDCRLRLKILKDDPTLKAVTWNDLLEMFIMQCCQNGLVLEETLDKIAKTGKAHLGIPSRLRMEFGIGTRWSNVGPLVESLRDEVQRGNNILSDVEDAVYEFVSAVMVSKAAEEDKEPEPEEEPGEEESLFKIPSKNTGGE